MCTQTSLPSLRSDPKAEKRKAKHEEGVNIWCKSLAVCVGSLCLKLIAAFVNVLYFTLRINASLERFDQRAFFKFNPFWKLNKKSHSHVNS